MNKKEIERIERLLDGAKDVRKNLPRDMFNKESKELDELIQRSEKLLKKLRRGEFEISIVGLEKAGKSTFANALIQRDVLPSAPDRCTFTSTKLFYGEEDKAEVELYTEREFNEIFKEMLRELDYPNVDSVNFRDMSIGEFERFFKSLAKSDPNLYKNHSGKTDEEIKDILKYKDDLELSGQTLIFKDSELESDNFKAYIKGIKINDVETNTAKPRSVKRLEIKSSKLDTMKNVVIYDVPGFDSPTVIHAKQTAERLKEADAIVLVTNVGDRPNITAPQLDILREESDADGIPLKEKLFVYGNKIDQAKENAEENKNVLIHEVVNRFNLTTRDRVFVGSALKYLVDLGIRNKDIDKNIESNIEAIREALENYYKNERMNIISKRVSYFQNSYKNLLKSIIDRIEGDLSIQAGKHKLNKIRTKILKKIEYFVNNKLPEYSDKVKKEIYEKRFFSTEFQKEFENGRVFKEIDDKRVNSILIKVNGSATINEEIERAHNYVREAIHQEYLNEFTNKILDLAHAKAIEIQNKIEKELFDILISDNENLSNDDLEKLEEEVHKFFLDVAGNILYEKGRFLFLIDRFSRNIFDLLLRYPIGSEDRKSKFDSAREEFFYLGYFYKNLTPLEVTKYLLTNDDKLDTNIKKIAQKLLTVLKNKSGIGLIEDMLNIFNLDTAKIIEILELSKNLKRATTKEDIIEELSKDREKLINLLINAVIPAINLELTFYNAINKQIKILREVQEYNSDKFDRYNEFINRVIDIISKNETEAIEKEIREREKLNSLKEIIEKEL